MNFLTQTKKKRRYLFFFIISFQLILPRLANSASNGEIVPSFKVPGDWLGNEFSTFSEEEKQSFEAGTDLIMRSQKEGLEKYQKPASRWHLFAVVFDLGVTLGGRLGALLLQGTPGVWLYWHPKPEKPKVQTLEDTSLAADDNGTFEISNESSPQLKAQIHNVVQSVYATGKVHYNPNLEEDLYQTTNNYFSIMDSTQVNSPTQWGLQQMRLDLQISGAGRLHFGATVGGAVRLRMHWIPQPKNNVSKGPLDEKQSRIAQGLSTVISQLLRELEMWSAQNPQKGFTPAYLRVGLGVLSNFDVGVVRGGAQAILHAYFIPHKNRTFNLTERSLFLDGLSENDSKGTALRIEPIDDKAAFASALGIEGEAQQSSMFQPLSPTKLPTEIPRDILQKGLNRAGRIGRFFLDRAQRLSQKSNWEVFRVKINMDLNMGGSIGLTTLAGDVQLEEGFNLQILEK